MLKVWFPYFCKILQRIHFQRQSSVRSPLGGSFTKRFTSFQLNFSCAAQLRLLSHKLMPRGVIWACYRITSGRSLRARRSGSTETARMERRAPPFSPFCFTRVAFAYFAVPNPGRTCLSQPSLTCDPNSQTSRSPTSHAPHPPNPSSPRARMRQRN